MKKSLTIAGILLLVLVAISLYSSFSKKKNTEVGNNGVPASGEVVCAQDAKLCPDGSYVGRSGPSCEFAKCPDVKAPSPKNTTTNPPKVTSESKVFKTVLGNPFNIDGMTVTPLQVLEDSRCPIGTTCAWAGKVRLSLKIEAGVLNSKVSQTSEISLTNSVVFREKKITLLSMNPVPVSGKNIIPAEYTFEFLVANK